MIKAQVIYVWDWKEVRKMQVLQSLLSSSPPDTSLPSEKYNTAKDLG